MILADLGAEIAAALAAAVAAGQLPAAAARLRASGTWRPAPDGARLGRGPGRYATSLPFLLARQAGTAPVPLAGLLAERLGSVGWIDAAATTGEGYLTVAVSARHLAGLPARIVVAGPAAASGDALSGTTLTAPTLPDLAAAPDWRSAWQASRAALTGRLRQAAGAQVMFVDSQQFPSAGSPRSGRPGPVRAAAACYGVDAVRYALARTAAFDPRAIERLLAARRDLDNPFTLVGHAHADAASTLRWAASLGLGYDEGDDGGVPAARAFAPALTTAPAELWLLDAMSWLPERVAAAARRRRPAELAVHLEATATAWLDCRETCPALPFGGRAAPSVTDRPLAAARLRLADAARVALAAGLALLGVAALSRT